MLVVARGLCRTYTTIRGPIAAVADVGLEVGRGEFLAICGRSGSGKSTLLGMLGGLCRPSSGSILVDGTDLAVMGPAELADFRARRFGFMFQFAGLLPNLRALDNVALPALLAGGHEAEANAMARELLGRVGLADRWDAYPGELSGGQQRRVAVARALINRPLLLLADEPTNDLDEQAENEVLSLLIDMHRTHSTTLVVVTHDPSLARRADRVVTLRSGRLVSDRRLAHDDTTAAPEPAAVVAAAPEAGPGPFEAGPDSLTQAEPTPMGAGFARFLVGFVGWVALGAGALYAFDSISARYQRQALEDRASLRKKSEELALQQLRADIDDVTYLPDGRYEVRLYLQSFAPEKPFYVLGPEVRAFVQVDRTWQPAPIARGGEDPDRVHEVRGERRPIPFTLRIDTDRHDELIPGYLHVRISSAMVVSETAEPTDDLFERTDDYYIYLKPQQLSDDDVRARNRWQPGAVVPRWIPMPAH